MSSPLPQSRSIRVQRIAEAAVERARLTVVPRTRVRAPRVPFVTLVSLILLAGVVGLLMFNTSMQQSSFEATALENQASELRAEEQALRGELEELRDPQRIGEQARALGMGLASCPRFLYLGTNKVSAACPTPVQPLVVDPPPRAKPGSLVPERIKVVAPPVDLPAGTTAAGGAAGANTPANGPANTPANTPADTPTTQTPASR